MQTSVNLSKWDEEEKNEWEKKGGSEAKLTRVDQSEVAAVVLLLPPVVFPGGTQISTCDREEKPSAE